MYLPFFPLKLVVFPGELLHLHIFEPRYKDLLRDAERGDGTFGICVYIDQLMGYGTEVRLEEVSRRYEDGRLDIVVRGLKTFKISSFDNPIPGKLYPGGRVEFLPNDPIIHQALHLEYILYLREMLRLLDYSTDFTPEQIDSFSFSHKLGLTLEEELDLLKIESERKRTELLIHHFKRMIPLMKTIEQAKEKIRQNGHFKNLDPLEF